MKAVQRGRRSRTAYAEMEAQGGSVTLTPEDTLKLKGCALCILCRNPVWARVK